MNYYELDFIVAPAGDFQQDMLINELGEAGFDTFEETEKGFKAYIPTDSFDRDVLDARLMQYHQMFDFNYEVKLIPQKNWNEEWERNFEPIEIRNKVYVRATFHAPRPEFPFEIVIDPKMAFGTGHHETTSMMIDMMLDANLTGKNVLDMGCGTGILAILAGKLGASALTAIDYDPVCYESTVENSALNNVVFSKVICGSKEVIPDENYDVILANINRNILTDQMSRYAEVLRPGGEIYFSGFYENPDLDIIKKEAAKYGLQYINHKKTKEWVAAKFVK
jgi:ribosomal protein L11 methyltransferase